ncbi:alpha/beta fold hydrolase [Chloroflexota bacterium]
MSHGLEGSKDGGKWLGFVPKLISGGFACLRFNYRGCGTDKEKSDGEFIDSTLTRRIQDYNSAIDFVQSLGINKNKIGVIGSSFGGTVAIAAFMVYVLECGQLRLYFLPKSAGIICPVETLKFCPTWVLWFLY